jgi:putative addiction module component (TIGR02574 family)
MNMSVQLDNIRENALALPRDDRALLAHDLLDSLVEENDSTDPDLREVIEHRLREYEEGRVKVSDAYESLAKSEAKYASNRNASRS